MHHSKRSHCRGKPTHHNKEWPWLAATRKSRDSNEDPGQPKKRTLTVDQGPGDRAVNETDKTACPGGADILVERWMTNTKMNKRGSPMAKSFEGPGMLEEAAILDEAGRMPTEKVTK